MIFDELLEETRIPKMVKVKYHIQRGDVNAGQIPGIIKESLESQHLLDRIEKGKTVALTCGSREICNIDMILRSLIELLKEKGAEPFIFPAMGSHGGANAEGQKEILAGYGVTEETMGVPVKASMDTVILGKSPKGLEVHFDKYADEADYVIPIGRVKPHTDFRGKIESGLMKMLTIGCGKQHGANICHTLGFPMMAENVTEIARVILEKEQIPFGIAIVEDAFHGTYKIQAIAGEKMEEEEEKLLIQAKALVPGIPFDKVDVLVLDEIGKDVSGAGMDPNVTGRSSMLGRWKPFIERIVVLDLTEKSHHNGCGIGGADITTQRFFEKIDFVTSYPNGITSHDPCSMRIPPVMPDDECAVKMALQTCMDNDRNMDYRMIWMKNTLHVESFWISESLVEEAKKNPSLTIESEPEDIPFNENGNVIWLKEPVQTYGVHENQKR